MVVERSMLDVQRSRRVLEDALASAAILGESQKANARLKAEDLLQARSTWQSVPFRIMFEFNRRCNESCSFCGIERTNTGDLAPEVLERLLDEIGWGTMEIMPLAGGEPTLAPIHEIAPIVRRYRNYLNFITNGYRFDRAFYEPIADITARIQFSFHSHEPSTYRRLMPHGDLERVVRNLEDAVKIAEGTEAHVLTCLVLTSANVDSLSEYVRFVADLGIRRVIVQKLYEHSPGYAELRPDRDRDRDEVRTALWKALTTAKEAGVFVETNVDEIFGDPENRPRQRSRFDVLQENTGIVDLFHPGFCMATAILALVEWDGTVLPCCRDHIVLGNVLHSSFEEIWNGPAMQRLRQSFFQRSWRPNCAKCHAFYNGHP